jgi:hypothetical protein
VRFARRCIYFVPPAKTDEAAAGDVFEVVEVGGEEEEGYYEDEDAVLIRVGEIDREGGGTDKLSMKRTPKRYISRLPIQCEFLINIPTDGEQTNAEA